MLDIASMFQGIRKCLAAPQVPRLKPNPGFWVLNGAYESEADLVFPLKHFQFSIKICTEIYAVKN